MERRLVVLGVPLAALTVEEAVARGLRGVLVLAPSGLGPTGRVPDDDLGPDREVIRIIGGEAAAEPVPTRPSRWVARTADPA
jgi:hypothetical protein